MGTVPERSQKLSCMIFKWTGKGSRDSKDGSNTPAPVTAYKDNNTLIGNVI